MFIFVLQTIWLFISELAGKALDLSVVIKFLVYFAPKMVPLVLPLTILLSSIMVFGSFAENYEFAAMKSTGISLQRAMRSLSVFIFALAIAAFFFANNAIPWAEYNSYNLRRNIAKVKPALAIAEGQFNEIGDINIHVEEKSGDRGQYLKNVTIHRKKTTAGNYTVIKAEDGELLSSTESNILQLKLINGNYYDELINKSDRKNTIKKPHAQSSFKDYIVNVDLGNLNNTDLDSKNIDNRHSMLDVSELNNTIDSLYNNRKEDFNQLSKTLYNRSSFDALKVGIGPITDTIYHGNNVLDLFDNKIKIQILNLAINTANSSSQIINTSKTTFEGRTANRNRHILALHEKYVLGFACIILFFVGAPLGALIRKGGLGLPMIVAIVLFLAYHFIGLFATNSAKGGELHPILGVWMSTLIMLPLSIYLTSRATKDKGVFEMDVILVPLKKLFNSKSGLNDIKNIQSYSHYNKHTVDELVVMIKNNTEFDLDKKPKQIALQHLFDRGINLGELESKGLETPTYLNKAKELQKDYVDYSKTSLVTFSIGAILLILHFVFNNNKLPELAITVKSLSFIAFGIFILYVIVSSIFYSKFYHTLGKSKKRINPILILLTLPFYPIKHFILKTKTKEDFHLSCLENIK